MDGRRLFALISLLPCLLLVSGCSTISVVKVDSKGKRICGAVEGVPFYLSRPYIDVFEPFVVDTRIAWPKENERRTANMCD